LPPFPGLPLLSPSSDEVLHLISTCVLSIFHPISSCQEKKPREVHYTNKYSTAKFSGPWDSSLFPFSILQCGQMIDQLERRKLTQGPKMNGDDNQELPSLEKRKQV